MQFLCIHCSSGLSRMIGFGHKILEALSIIVLWPCEIVLRICRSRIFDCIQYSYFWNSRIEWVWDSIPGARLLDSFQCHRMAAWTRVAWSACLVGCSGDKLDHCSLRVHAPLFPVNFRRVTHKTWPMITHDEWIARVIKLEILQTSTIQIKLKFIWYKIQLDKLQKNKRLQHSCKLQVLKFIRRLQNHVYPGRRWFTYSYYYDII